ncbi:MAG TPA: sulfite exporter TauE/SafE family protein [Patescibacteria group bacterium]|nr:sulfite exporter TauE/SafE family protein [Patescibacteria group bacterium]
MVAITLMLIGLVAGALSGLVGVGGGVLIVPALVLLLGYSQKLAQGTTLMMLVLPVGIFAVITYARAGYVNFKAATWIALGFVVGALLSAHAAVKLPDQVITRVFGAALLAIAAKLLFFAK